ncbi:helix-hairpin-helix domain-containing protein [Chryseolinea sp. H1M3-3]|uniref:ComEA family DNA-binding protein n=1 Tax=Chryseolinea sp. H1M3-3 TaxID=3034144 RepID=UPI0023EC53DF|nr:helix-hairpin-helix domain-containing protein [Chryseolinea sp. H1M3-3]
MRILIIISCLHLAIACCCQDFPKKEIDVSQIADELFSQPDMDLNYEELYENLVQLMAHPINLNKGTAEDFRFLNLLSESQIDALIKYRTQNQKFISIYELQTVPEFDLPTIYKVVPFLTVTDQTTALDASLWRRIKKEGENYFLIRYEQTLQQKNGFQNTVAPSAKFKGSPDKIYIRFRSSRPGDFSFGFTTEKDPGEQIRWAPSSRYYGLDYFSCHFQLQNKGRIKNLIVGDYQSQFGQGLMLGGIFGTGKGSETITSVRRSNIGLLPYTSVYESGGMRGIGLTLEATKKIALTTFVSRTNKDATVVDNDQEDIIASFAATGLHRNESELLKRKQASENNFAAIIQYKYNALDGGLMLNHVVFDSPIERTPTAYNQFAFAGKTNTNIGIYLNYTVKNITFFSEVAQSLKAGTAASAGILTSLSPKLDVSVVYRKFDRDFHTFYSSGFGEGSNTQNEEGIYWGWKYSFSRRYSVSGYVDIFKFPWLRFRSYAPSTGHEWLLRFNYEPSRKVKIFIQAREEFKSRNIESDSTNQYILSAGKKNNYWVSFDYSPHSMLRFKSRAQFSTYSIENKKTQGFALMQDLIIDLGKLKLTMRYGLFETEDYDNRQYAYENDVWLAYSLPAYYGAGVRKMIILQYKINRHITFWFRYAHIRYQHQNQIGSGIDSIEGNTKDDIKAQMVFRF